MAQTRSDERITLAPPSSDFRKAPISTRSSEATVDALHLERWSSRAFTREPVASEVLRSLFEAARWAPSAMNAQPWLFVYADAEEDLARFRPLLRDSNRRWADSAPVLAFAFAKRRTDGGDVNRSAAFDTGAAWMSLALEATRRGLAVHAMGGIHYDKVHSALGVPVDEYDVLCGIAIGHRGAAAALPEDIAAREVPSTRKPLAEVAVRGRFAG